MNISQIFPIGSKSSKNKWHCRFLLVLKKKIHKTEKNRKWDFAGERLNKCSTQRNA